MENIIMLILGVFIYNVKNVVKVRTGEVGREALIDESK